MRLLAITEHNPQDRPTDGISRVSYELHRRLRERHDISTVSLDQVGAAPGTPSTVWAALREPHQPWFTVRQPRAALGKVLTERSREQFDGVIIGSPLLAWAIPLFSETPIVLHAIDALSLWFSEQATRSHGLRRCHFRREATLATQLEHDLYPQAKAVIVVSELDAQVIRAHAPGAAVTVIPNGVDTQYFHPEHVGKQVESIVFTGAMDYPPNVQAVESFARTTWPLLTSARPSLRWVIAGREPSAAVRQLAERDARITVTGTLDDLRPSIWASDVVIAPLLSGAGVKNKVLEALACGKAVVCSPRAVNGLDVQTGRDLIVADGPRATADAVLRLLRDPEDRQALGRRARLAAERFSWTAVAKKYERVYADAF